MSEPQYKRVLLKLSGEALAGAASRGLDFDVIGSVCDVIKKCVAQGVQGMQVPQGTNSYVYMDSMQQMQPSVVQGGNVMGQSMVNMVGIGRGSDEKYNFPEN